MTAPRVLFISNSQVAIFEWQRSALLAPAVFNADAEGRAAFEQYVKSDTATPVTILVDVIEEEFRNELIPHVRGKDHAILVARRAEQAFRLTPYRAFEEQGRKRDGKREDQVLLSGLTNPDVLRPWLELLSQQKVPVTGMHSVSHLTGEVLEKIGAKDKCALLITRQEFGGLRQAYFLSGQLKISRQAPVHSTSVRQYGDLINAEIDKTRRYLDRLKLVDRDATLHIHVVNEAASINELRDVCGDAAGIQFHFHAIEPLIGTAARTGSEQAYGELLYARLLRKRAPKANYATAAERRYNLYRRAKLSLYGLSVAAVAGGLIWSAVNLIELQLMREYGSTANQLAAEMHERYERVLSEIPKTPVSPNSLRIGVEIANTLLDQRSLPQPMLSALSHGLAEFREVRVQSIEWVPTQNPSAVKLGQPQTDDESTQDQNSSEDPALQLPPTESGKPNLYHVALLRANIKPFDGDYKKAFEIVERFIAALKKNSDVVEAVAVDLPLNTRSTAALQGKAGVSERDFTAEFSVRTVLKGTYRGAL